MLHIDIIVHTVAKKRCHAVGFPHNRMLMLSSSRGIRIGVPVLSVSWSLVDHPVIIQALRKGLIEREATDTGGVPRWKSSCPGRPAEAAVRTPVGTRVPGRCSRFVSTAVGTYLQQLAFFLFNIRTCINRRYMQ